MNNKKQTLKQKIEAMIQEGSIILSDFMELDQWDQTNPERRSLSEEEKDHLRTQAQKRVSDYNKHVKP